jgi:hypothetical protein
LLCGNRWWPDPHVAATLYAVGMGENRHDVAPDQLLNAAARSVSGLEALLTILETRPDAWSHEQYATAWVRAARHMGDLAVIVTHGAVVLRRDLPRLERLVRWLTVLVVLQGLGLVGLAVLLLRP